MLVTCVGNGPKSSIDGLILVGGVFESSLFVQEINKDEKHNININNNTTIFFIKNTPCFYIFAISRLETPQAQSISSLKEKTPNPVEYIAQSSGYITNKCFSCKT